MLINENRLRKIIRKTLLERFDPSVSKNTNKAYYPVEFGKNPNKTLEGNFLGGDKAQGFYIVIDADEESKLYGMGGHKVQDRDNISYILSAVKKNGNTIKKEKLESLIKAGRVIWVSDLNWLHEPMSADEKEGYGSWLRDSGIEAGANISAVAAGAALAAGMVPLSAALESIGNGFNVADVFNKIDQKNYMGSIFSAIGLIPGGDAIGLLKKVGKLDDVFPASLADDIAREIIKLVEGDSLDTLAELVHAWAEDRNVDTNQINPILSSMIKAGKEVASGFQKIAAKGDVKVKKLN